MYEIAGNLLNNPCNQALVYTSATGMLSNQKSFTPPQEMSSQVSFLTDFVM